MDGNKILVLDNVSVRYRKQDSRSTSDIVKRILGKAPRNNEFWALKNISFSLERGDMLGVIGKNGAGKSTMMKAISGTLTPASGTIEKTGRICALLELGTGFDREMTVRENVYLRGAFMGYDREFIDSKYDEIIDFAEMREFQNSPFRTLSSGMKSRIAFAIASMIEPDIIILDEIFAVGDGDFRRKSQQKMQSIIDNGDTTALMVSHSLQAVRSQCNKVLWLDRAAWSCSETRTLSAMHTRNTSIPAGCRRRSRLPKRRKIRATRSKRTPESSLRPGLSILRCFWPS